jgi:hypothetical protein
MDGDGADADEAVRDSRTTPFSRKEEQQSITNRNRAERNTPAADVPRHGTSGVARFPPNLLDIALGLSGLAPLWAR